LRNVPITTFINKLDRWVLDPFDVDEIKQPPRSCALNDGRSPAREYFYAM
jgi:hypothetical protein